MCRQWPCPSDWTAKRLDSASEMSCRYRQNHETTRQNADIFQLYQRQWCKTTIPIMVKIWSNHEQDIDNDKDWIDTLRSQLEFKAHLESSSSTLLSIANASETSMLEMRTLFLDTKNRWWRQVSATAAISDGLGPNSLARGLWGWFCTHVLPAFFFQRCISCMERIHDNVWRQKENMTAIGNKRNI